MRAFVTGATGFVGGRLARRLRDRGDEVVVLVRSRSRAAELSALGCELVEGDLSTPEALRSGVEDCDAAFHAAAVYRLGIRRRERESVLRANVGGTESVLDAASAAGVGRIVHVSTIGVFGNTRGRVVDETYERRPEDGFLSVYDESKWLAHRAASERAGLGAPVVIVQPGAVYGPGDTSQLGGELQRAYDGTLRYLAFPDTGVNFVHVDDVVDGMLLALEHGRPGESYVLGGTIGRLRDAYAAAARLGGRRLPRLTVPAFAVLLAAPVAPLLGLPPNLREVVRSSKGVTYWGSDAKARGSLGYAPRDLETGLRQTFARGAGAAA
jgi:dihydroflavonol-4-reductase